MTKVGRVEKVLIVDDDVELRSIIRDLLLGEGYWTLEAGDGLAAVEAFRREAPDAVLLDLRMPGRDGLGVLEQIVALDRTVPVIMLSGHGDIPTAVRAVKLGAYDFIAKPPDFDKLALTVRKALERRALEQEVRRVTAALESSLEGTFGTSAAMREVIGKIARVAQTDLAVIVQGETGAGKSYVAGAIHQLSPRAGRPFVRVDLSVIPETLAESELFGAKRGAYTGAERDKAGYFAGADGGTIFLDDIENASPAVQAKLLEVIEGKRIFPVGGGEAVALDFRVVAATNRDLKACVAGHSFREDLFYRLGEFMIVVPPLRERPEDIRFFAGRFLADSCTELGKSVQGFTDEALALLLGHPWPGNVRELKNVVRRATLLAGGDRIGRECIDFLAGGPGAAGAERGAGTLREATRELERRLICEALERAGGKRTEAARLLGVSYSGLMAKIKDHRLA